MGSAKNVALLLCVLFALSDGTYSQRNISKEFLHQLLESSDSRIRPTDEDDGPLVVGVNFHVMSISAISEVNMEFKMDIFFREIWKDLRLVYQDGPPTLSLPSRFIDEIWTPDLYFPNGKDAKFHTVTVPNRRLKLYQDGTVIYSIRLTLILSCPMELATFPLDTQTCAIKVESYAYEANELQLVWKDPAVDIDDELELPQFELVNINNATCSKQYKTTGRFSCLKMEFTLHRHFGFFLLQTYIPSALIIILSWVSFWINMDAVPARIALGVTTVLTMTTYLTGSKNSAPKTSYPKAIDIWMSMGMLFVFAALLEYAFVNAISRKQNKEPKKEEIELQHSVGQTTSFLCGPRDVNYRQMARNIDKVSRFAFPSAFVVYNLIYWSVFAGIR